MEEFRTGHAFIDMGEYNTKMALLDAREKKVAEAEKAMAEGKIEVLTYFSWSRGGPEVRYTGKVEAVIAITEQLMSVAKERDDLKSDYERAKRRTMMMMDAIAKIVPDRFIAKVNKQLAAWGYDDE